MFDDRQVVADQQVSQAELLFEVLQQVENLRLHRHVQRRSRFVADQHVGAHHQRPCNRHALALPTGELAGVAVDDSFRQADHVHHRLDTLTALSIAADVMHDQRQGDDFAKGFARVQRRVRVLKDRLDVPRHFLAVGAGQMLAVDQHIAAAGREQAEQHLR
ncbi:hypothetical protein ALP75_202330 [Pseudomonas syringae pv. actinidiae]|nr:hypothetical protein ALP75_202330 [Pseudomonas syringae pv. actinidiae]